MREQYSGNGAGSSLVGGGSSHVGANFLLEKHVEVLTEVLAGHSSEWYSVGIALRLPHILKGIRITFGQHGVKICLYQLLHEWIVGRHEHSKPSTV